MTTKLNDAFIVKLDDLDDSQRAAVTSTADNVLVKAPAGSGKTSSVIAAIAAYRYEYINDRICAITYTRAARAEMEQRLEEMGIRDVEVTTIHVWSRNLLEFFAAKYDFQIHILQEAQIKAILTDIVKEYIIHAKTKNINIGILYSFITGNKNMDITDNYRRALMALERRYIAYKKDNGLYDFTDYPLYLYNVIKAYNETIDNIDALFVDEFQDVDSIQFDLFELVNCRKKFYCGDAWQSIFIFRNADGEVFNKAKGFEEYKLKHNYRSYQEIIDYASTVYLELKSDAELNNDCYISQIMHRYDSSIVCERGYGGTVYVANPYGRCFMFHNQDTRKIDINEAFVEIMNRNPMILCRTNKQVKAINEYSYYDASTVHQAKGLEYPNVIVIDTTIDSIEELNIAYVALTRARDSVLVINWQQFEILFNKFMKYGG